VLVIVEIEREARPDEHVGWKAIISDNRTKSNGVKTCQ
jgi:hypothetical protein